MNRAAMLLLGLVVVLLVFGLTAFLPTQGASPQDRSAAATMAALPKPEPAARPGAAQAAKPSAEQAAKPSAEQLASQGRTLATRYGCVACHSADGAQSLGGTWKGLYGSQRDLEGGQRVTADDAYLTESIRDPDAKVVRGMPRGVMSPSIQAFRNDLNRQETLDALIAYIRSLR